jgi:hypothetical protein
MARCASRSEWNPLGFAHRCSLARSARPLPALANLPSPFSTMAARWHSHATSARARRRLTGAGQTRSLRDVHRRQLQFGEKGGAAIGPTRRGKGSKIMAIADRHGLPIACSVASTSRHETALVEATLEQRFTQVTPQRMIGDRAYDSDPLDQHLRQKHRIRLIAHHKSNRRRRNTQDGRELRRYCRRWKIERLFALVAQLPPTGQPLGISRSQFPRYGPTRLSRHPAKEFVRLASSYFCPTHPRVRAAQSLPTRRVGQRGGTMAIVCR